MREAMELPRRDKTSLNRFFLPAIAERAGAERTERLFGARAMKHADRIKVRRLRPAAV